MPDEQTEHVCDEACADRDPAFWARIERLDAEADDDVRNGRVRPVTEEFIEQLWALVRRSPAGG